MRDRGKREECLCCCKLTTQGRWLRLDKRKPGDGLMGSAWFCDNCLEGGGFGAD